ncbi:hypothetical protein LZC95_48920 [Pendulispora brunnea]|uniref:DUF7919 domain-containing protein n=1 Tax=Pendulispora brunnea TaxID=2905690 RepID=A0ABZ2KAG5_9BACT
MWFEDLTPYTYGQAKSTSPSTLNVGWLERGQDYPAGEVPAAFSGRLAQLVEHARTQATRGMHRCDLCPSGENEQHPQGQAEIRAVGADGTPFAAPSLIHHYVTVHRYQPPVVFIAAVMRSAHLEVDDALARDLCLGCGVALERPEKSAVMRESHAASRISTCPNIRAAACTF